MLKTFFDDPAMPPPGLEGQGVTARGGDPNADTSGTSGLQPLWNDAPVGNPAGAETANSVSGLPGTPSRWEPSGTPPSPPDLTDRTPGTIDQR